MALVISSESVQSRSGRGLEPDQGIVLEIDWSGSPFSRWQGDGIQDLLWDAAVYEENIP